MGEGATSRAGLVSKKPQGRRAKPLRWVGDTGKSSGRMMWLVPTTYQRTMSWRSSRRFAEMKAGMPSPPVVGAGGVELVRGFAGDPELLGGEFGALGDGGFGGGHHVGGLAGEEGVGDGLADGVGPGGVGDAPVAGGGGVDLAA